MQHDEIYNIILFLLEGVITLGSLDSLDDIYKIFAYSDGFLGYVVFLEFTQNFVTFYGVSGDISNALYLHCFSDVQDLLSKHSVDSPFACSVSKNGRHTLLSPFVIRRNGDPDSSGFLSFPTGDLLEITVVSIES